MKSINVVFYLFINFTFQGSTGSLFLKIRQHVYLELVFKMMLIKPQICQQISFGANLFICFLDNLFTKCLYGCIQISNYECLQWSYALHKIVHADTRVFSLCMQRKYAYDPRNFSVYSFSGYHLRNFGTFFTNYARAFKIQVYFQFVI